MIKVLWRRAGPWFPWLGVLLLLFLLLQAVQPSVLLAALRGARLWLLLPVLACAVLGLLLRGLRWHMLVRTIDAPNSVGDSLILYTAAQAALLVPGGQFLLPVLQRSQHGTLLRRSAPTILVQELVFGLVVLPAALPGVPPYHPAGWMLLAAFVFNAGTGLFLAQIHLPRRVLRLLERLPIVRGHVHNILELQRHFGVVARSRQAAWGTLLDMGAIGLAGLGFYLSLLAVGVAQATWVDSLAVYALGSSVGTLSALPGGLGATEDVSTLVLGRMGVATGPAAAATLLFRVANLLIGTAIGWAVLVLARRRLKIHPSPAGLARAIRGVDERTAETTGGPVHLDRFLGKA